jgi:anti-repressor protein
MEELKIFNYEGKEVRTVDVNGEPWWVLKDVCDILEHSNPSTVADRLDDDEKAKIDPKQYLGSRSNEPLTVISESGLYSAILLSRKPEAKKFKKWVTSEVLPSIRKHGGYIKATAEDTDADIMARALIIAQKTIDDKNNRISALSAKIEADSPKVTFADAVSTTSSTILIGDLAKILKGNGIDIGQNRLFKWLRNNGYLIKREGADYNSPTQRAMDMELFKIKESTYELDDGRVQIVRTTKVTGKGQQYFINKFLAKEEMLCAPQG